MSETIEECRARIRDIVAGPGRSSRWITKHLEFDDPDWCLIYPFVWEQDHYPKYRTSRSAMKNWPVHRLMCEYRHGPPPTPQHHSAHSCDRGTEGCVNPMHVSWKTASENQAERHAKGFTPRSKLTPEDVDQIRALEGRERPIDIARKFGVSLRNVRFILSGQAWRSDGPYSRRIFSADEVIAIRRLKGTARVTDIAKQFNANWSQIDRIVNRKTYLWVPESADEAPPPHHSIP
ncbi:hypothetical protein KUL72_20705 [Bradyrhizobium arachidis]|uniref:hypothetical protein n=1 Tax=Bradyrhizobium arachidis TaxID=858423 RepID=UPI0021614F33|nr:hypothetical protein [Bradyrhizobium arachidis]UVO33937.1 hypothetical protein KUL72_20705 [Bradyrhizobium arachidis]